MQRSLKELHVDTSKMPLGKLSKKHILDSYTVLTELQNVIDSKNPSQNAIVGAHTHEFPRVCFPE